MAQLTAAAVLFAWEQGRRRHPLDRALLLYALAAPDEELGGLADRTIGQRNRALLELRRAMFGEVLEACVDCPRCSERLEFAVSAAALISDAQPVTTGVDVDGVRFRLPTSRDLGAIAAGADAESAALRLIARLADSSSELELQPSAALALRLEAALDAADPNADLVLNLDCPACGHGWTSPFDIASYLWNELDARARHLLDEVHVLARAYGWSEREILGLSETRRAAYIERALA